MLRLKLQVFLKNFFAIIYENRSPEMLYKRTRKVTLSTKGWPYIGYTYQSQQLSQHLNRCNYSTHHFGFGFHSLSVCTVENVTVQNESILDKSKVFFGGTDIIERWNVCNYKGFLSWTGVILGVVEICNLLTPDDLLIRLVCIKHTKHNSTDSDKHFEGSFIKIGWFLPELLDFTFLLPHFLGHPLDTEVVTFSDWLQPLSCEYSIAMKWFHDLWVLNFQKNIGSICPSRWYQYLDWLMD